MRFRIRKIDTKNRSCQNKRGHQTLEQARAHLNSLVSKGAYRPSLVIYRCKKCKLLHVGHKSPAEYSGRVRGYG